MREGEYSIGNRVFQSSGFDIAWMDRLKITPKVIFDVGAYDGGDAIRFKRDFPDAEVHSFEACPHRGKIIQEYISDFGVTFTNCGVGRETGTKLFYPAICTGKDGGDTHSPGDYGGQGSYFKHTQKYKGLYPHIKQQNSELVLTTTIAKYCSEQNISSIDLLHIDVEGSEYNVIKGMRRLDAKVVYLETLDGMFEDAKISKEIIILMGALGYSIVANFTSDKLFAKNYILKS